MSLARRLLGIFSGWHINEVQASNEQAMNELLSHLEGVNGALGTQGVRTEDTATLFSAANEDKVYVAHAAAGKWGILAQRNRVEDLLGGVKTDAEGHSLAFC